ncbi:protein huluwa [Scleropages formosus]|uniref:protein huluwa n=1 Tax=Scleropages formosus TaxID=113540 RepID=UPI0010FA8314|nr:protein huluwa-like [Scleropages formosus]
MSHTGPFVPPSEWSESSSISRLAPLLLLLVPSVLLLLLLNCVFLGYKLLLSAKRRRRRRRRRRLDSESTLSRMAETTSSTIVNGDGERGFDPINPAQSVSSCLTSSKESAAAPQTVSNTMPDRATGTGTGSGSVRALSTVMAALSTTESTARAELPPRVDWRRGEPLVPPPCSDSDTERGNPVPPNSPELHGAASTCREPCYTCTSRERNVAANCESQRTAGSARPLRRSSTVDMKEELVHLGATSPRDLRFQCGYTSSIPAENSVFVTSASSSTGGPGLDSDFGASAGVSLRILSCDGEGLSEAIPASGLEWDYYDPCYVSQNHVPRHMFHMPTVTAKQYWV